LYIYTQSLYIHTHTHKSHKRTHTHIIIHGYTLLANTTLSCAEALVLLTVNINTCVSKVCLWVVVCHRAAINALVRFPDIPNVKRTLNFIVPISATLHRFPFRFSDSDPVRMLQS